MSLHRKLAQLDLHYIQVFQEWVRASGQGGPQLGERFLSIGQEKGAYRARGWHWASAASAISRFVTRGRHDPDCLSGSPSLDDHSQ